MTQNLKSSLRFEKYQVNNINFRLNDKFSNDEEDINIDLSITKSITYDEANKKGSVKLITKVFDNAYENNYPYSCNLEVTGYFSIEGTDNKEECERLLNINAVAILFPYIRALISTYTANANVAPLILPPINVNKLTASK